MRYFNRALNILLEGVAAKLPLLLKMLLSEKSQWKYIEDGDEASEFILSLQQWDPTGNNGTYIPYIVRQLAMGNLKILPDYDEDGPRILETLTYFHKNKNKPDWTLDKDINKIGDWHQIEKLIDSGNLKSKREEKKSLSGVGVDLVFEMTLPNKEESNYKIYRFIEPESTAIWGFGTRWCTTTLSGPQNNQVPTIKYAAWHPKAGQERELSLLKLSKDSTGYPTQADHYLNGHLPGPLYMIFRKNKTNQGDVGGGGQLVLVHAPTKQIKDNHDIQLANCSFALDYVIAHWMKADKDAPADFLNWIRSRCKDYRGRP